MTFPKLFKCHGSAHGGHDPKRTGSTRHLTRIIIFLIDINVPQTITQIRNATNVVSNIQDSLQWLVSNKIVCKEHFTSTKMFHSRKSGWLYFINPKWQELREE